MAANNVKKSSQAFGYKYTDLASINEFLNSQGIGYSQYVETSEINGEDYIFTVPVMNGRGKDGEDLVLAPRRGCKIPKATLAGNKVNPAQEYGSALTYARRYSLLMAFGLACEDGDAQVYTVDLVSEKQIAELKDELKRTGISVDVILNCYEKKSLKELTEDDYTNAMKRLAKSATKEDK